MYQNFVTDHILQFSQNRYTTLPTSPTDQQATCMQGVQSYESRIVLDAEVVAAAGDNIGCCVGVVDAENRGPMVLSWSLQSRHTSADPCLPFLCSEDRNAVLPANGNIEPWTFSSTIFPQNSFLANNAILSTGCMLVNTTPSLSTQQVNFFAGFTLKYAGAGTKVINASLQIQLHYDIERFFQPGK